MTFGASVLHNAVQSEVNSGKRVIYQTPESVTLEWGKRVNNILHLIISIVTFGFWSIVWAIFAFTGGVKREVLALDSEGNLTRTQQQSSEPLWAKVVSGIFVALLIIGFIVSLAN